MEFKENTGGGIPLFLNGSVVAWVCTTINGKWSYVIAHYNCDKSPRFDNQHDAKMALLGIFGE